MLQSSMFSQLARIIKNCRKHSKFQSFPPESKKQMTVFSTSYPGPMSDCYRRARVLLEMLGPDEKHWFVGGKRSSAVAICVLEKDDVIAVPTDTIYGFAALAQSKKAIDKLYAIKGRDKTKPLAITLSSVSEIEKWSYIDHLPWRLLPELLPGPVTVVLKRKENLNPSLNPGHDSVGIRVPGTKFIRHVCKSIEQPLALTSANISNEPSSLDPDEFSPLWPKLGAIFHDVKNSTMFQDSQRIGSTVIDLTIPGEFHILRRGVRYHQSLQILRHFLLREREVLDRNILEDRQQECSARVGDQ